MIRRFAAALGLAATAVAAGSCADVAGPSRNFYDWRLVSGADTISFHWPADRQPVRVWVQDTLALREHATAGIAQWRRAFLYGEFSAVLVTDSTRADVIVRGAPIPIKPVLAGARRLGSLAPECEGATDLDIDQPATRLQLPIRAYVNPRFAPTDPATVACLALTITHELGHAFGIFRHSTEATNLMFANPVVARPSNRDLQTMEVLYHFPATIAVTGP